LVSEHSRAVGGKNHPSKDRLRKVTFTAQMKNGGEPVDRDRTH
jgi:hypothetical protein